MAKCVEDDGWELEKKKDQKITEESIPNAREEFEEN